MTKLDREGRSPLHYAALQDDVAEIEALLVQGEDPDLADARGFTALHLAAQERAVASVRRLLEAGADPNKRNAAGNSPLFVAVFNSRGDGEIIQLLRARGADPFLENRSGQTPLGLAHLIGNYPVAQFFEDLPDADLPSA